MTLLNTTIRAERYCGGCNRRRCQKVLLSPRGCCSQCPSCKESLFEYGSEPLRPEQFDYPSRCKSCDLHFYYVEYQYRIRVVLRNAPLAPAVFEAASRNQDEIRALESKISDARYDCFTRGPGWKGVSVKLTEDEQKLL